MIRSALVTLVLAAFSPAALAVNGQISNLELTYKFAASPGNDYFDINASYTLGEGSDGLGLPNAPVTFSFDGGRFIQSLPSGSLVPITGGWRYLAPTGSSGLTQVKIMTSGTILIQARKLDLTGSKPTAFQSINLSVGDEFFSATPNSLPVGRITGPTAATVNDTVSLFATNSSDYNGQQLTFSWSLVSQPLGSSVSLSSTTNPSTSFIGSHNGAYVVKLVPHDGVSEGTPALITVQVSGAAEEPPPPPGHENGLISISTNQASYLVGEQAVLTLLEEAQPGNGTNRWFFRATLNDQPIAFTTVSTTEQNYTTPIFEAAGSYLFKVDLYMENANLARALAAAITSYTQDIAAVDAALLYETDPAVIAQLQAQKAYDLEQIANAQDQLEQNRTKVGETVQLTFEVTAP